MRLVSARLWTLASFRLGTQAFGFAEHVWPAGSKRSATESWKLLPQSPGACNLPAGIARPSPEFANLYGLLSAATMQFYASSPFVGCLPGPAGTLRLDAREELESLQAFLSTPSLPFGPSQIALWKCLEPTRSTCPVPCSGRRRALWTRSGLAWSPRGFWSCDSTPKSYKS